MLWLHIPDLFWLVIGALTTFRITSVIHGEAIGAPIRRLIGAVETDEMISYPDTFLGHMFECFWCLSFWVAVGVTLWLVLLPAFPWGIVLLPFAMSAGAIVIKVFFLRLFDV